MECFVKALLQLWGWETLVRTNLMDDTLCSLCRDDIKQTATFRCYSAIQRHPAETGLVQCLILSYTVGDQTSGCDPEEKQQIISVVTVSYRRLTVFSIVLFKQKNVCIRVRAL